MVIENIIGKWIKELQNSEVLLKKVNYINSEKILDV
ncbi:MAG: hypothetical protein FD122_3746 [Stygiobacter sp.]|nr:MAG: hypothetical protein FD122_3746 [Stygiobacter sp.]